MALKIRLSRGGSKKRPFYRIVVAEASAPRDGRYVERVGHYNPMMAKDNDQRLVVNGDRVKHWLGLGAQPTERVQKLLSSVSLTDPVKLREQPKKSAPGKKRAEREAEAAEAAEAATAQVPSAEEASAEEIPAEEASAEEAPAEEASAQEVPAEEASAEEVPAEEAPAKEAAGNTEEKA